MPVNGLHVCWTMEASANSASMRAPSGRNCAKSRRRTARFLAPGPSTGVRVAVVSNDFTVVGASSSVINGKKMRHIREIADRRGMPLVFLGEFSGARMPDRMGAAGRATLGRIRTSSGGRGERPGCRHCSASCYGSSTWYGCMSDFVVMRKGATMAVASSKVTSLAINQPIDQKSSAAGGCTRGRPDWWTSPSTPTKKRFDVIKAFLSYLPSDNASHAPSCAGAGCGLAAKRTTSWTSFPKQRSKQYDIKTILSLFVDKGSLFETEAEIRQISGHGAEHGSTAVRSGSSPATPDTRAGRSTWTRCRKVTSFIVLCDSFNIPLAFPGRPARAS